MNKNKIRSFPCKDASCEVFHSRNSFRRLCRKERCYLSSRLVSTNCERFLSLLPLFRGDGRCELSARRDSLLYYRFRIGLLGDSCEPSGRDGARPAVCLTAEFYQKKIVSIGAVSRWEPLPHDNLNLHQDLTTFKYINILSNNCKIEISCKIKN